MKALSERSLEFKPDERIGTLLAVMRGHANLSVSQAGERLEVARTSIYRAESGAPGSAPSIELLFRMAATYNFHVNLVFGARGPLSHYGSCRLASGADLARVAVRLREEWFPNRSDFADRSGIERSSLYRFERALPGGNLNTLLRYLGGMGARLVATPMSLVETFSKQQVPDGALRRPRPQ